MPAWPARLSDLRFHASLSYRRLSSFTSVSYMFLLHNYGLLLFCFTIERACEVFSAYTRRYCLSVLLVTMIWHCIVFVDSLSLCTLDMSNSCQSLLSKTVHANCSTCHRIASIYRWGERWTKNLYTLLRENGNDLSGIGKNWNVIVYEIAHVIVFVHVRQLYVFAT